MSLIIEDGTIVAGAVSYVTAAEARAWAAKRGVTLSADDAVLEPLLVKACDYLQSIEGNYRGSRVDDAQPLAWPRQKVYLFGNTTAIAVTYVPQQLKDAQCQLAIDAGSRDLQPTGDGREVLMKQVDVLVTQYARSGSGVNRPILDKAMGILSPLLRSSGPLTANRG